MCTPRRTLVERFAVRQSPPRHRTQGEALDEPAVQRISSFLKSYAEMRKGEQLVMGEIRARARERIRWSLSLILLAVALLFAPLPWRRLWARLQPTF